MKSLFQLVLGCAMAPAFLAVLTAQSGSPVVTQSPANPDKQFAIDAAMTGMAEIELGKLAASKASSPAVKTFAALMVTDHTKAADELKGIAALNNITLPKALEGKHKATFERLSLLSGEAFDRAYAEEMAQGHQLVVTAFKGEAAEGKDPSLKEWATHTLPTIEKHLEMAQQLGRML